MNANFMKNFRGIFVDTEDSDANNVVSYKMLTCHIRRIMSIVD